MNKKLRIACVESVKLLPDGKRLGLSDTGSRIRANRDYVWTSSWPCQTTLSWSYLKLLGQLSTQMMTMS